MSEIATMNNNNRSIKAPRLLLRCFAQRDGTQWVAVCVDFNLAAQADTFREAKRKLHEQIVCYVTDAIVGDDREFAAELLTRRAPWSIMARYYAAWAVTRAHSMKDSLRSFFEPLPLQPASHCPAA